MSTSPVSREPAAQPAGPAPHLEGRPPGPRTLADQLRGWTDEQLATLLTERPDLAGPAPQDTSSLASRLGTRSSVLLAVDQLTRLELVVLDAALAVGGTASAALLRERVNAAPDAVDRALDRLRALGLLWGTDSTLRALSILPDVLGTRLSGLGPPAASLLAGYGPARVAALAADLGLTPTGDRHDDVAAVADRLADPAHVSRLLADVDPQARAILEHLDREGRDGSVESTERTTSRGPGGPVDQLLSRGLLVARDTRHVAVPREVAICLRGGRTTRARADDEPALSTAERGAALVDRTAAGAAFELVRQVELVLEQWGSAPPPALRTGGLGVRDLKATAELLHVDERGAALLVEVAWAAGLVAVGTGPSGLSAWLPTDAFDGWTAAPVAERWSRLASAWLDGQRLVGLVGSRESTPTGTGLRGKPVNALVPGLERTWLPETRRAALLEVASLRPGTVLAATTGLSSLLERLAWLRPRRPSARAQAVSWAVEESAVMGVTALGGVAAHGRALLAADDPHAESARALEPLLPAPVDHVLVQADLTAIAPGPLDPALGRRLGTVADVESRGGATVYRFTERSVRRAFDSGWSAAEVHDFVAAASRTPVPQALTYLVDDVSRRFGTVRAGAAESFLRSDDESALAELVHHPKAAALRLRRIAPTVVVSDVPLDVLLPRLRELGAAPVVEAPDGSVRLSRAEVLRARTPRRPPALTDTAVPVDRLDPVSAARLSGRIAAAVTAIRAGDRAADTRPGPGLRAVDPPTPAATLTVLREAVESRHSVWIGYVDSSGSSGERVVDPVKVDAGWLSAYDHRTEDVRSFAVHRITAVRVLET
ncbi:MAG TPA: helicase C-terminal domain-containing protein [Nocardioidaceae bacterium]|nr:helicase C-terminal domain-containing protein [Nocardioidaceae bacterium]